MLFRIDGEAINARFFSSVANFYLIKYDENTVGYDIGFSYAVFCSLTFFY